MSYQRADVKAPVLSGAALRAFVSVLESGVGNLVVQKLVADSGIELFRAKSPGAASPLHAPLPFPTEPGEPESTGPALAARAVAAPAPVKGAARETIAAFAKAYAQGADPVTVLGAINRHIDELESGDVRMNFFIARKPEAVLRAAEESAKRLREGSARSVLEGVPVVVKDEVDVAGFPTTLGTSIFTTPATRDGTVVERLKAAGAVILGKANMNEIGINPIGLNPHYGPARNPFDRTRITGGSSSGSASTVSAGLAPVSIGLDGGGSIRIPAGLCGVVGLKATSQRISEAGVPPLCWSVGHIGPIGATVADVAALYSLIAGPDAREPLTLAQPPLSLAGFEVGSLEGVRLGICWPFFEDAEPDVVARCREAVRACTEAGATVVELPPPDLNTTLWTHSVLILSEMAQAMLPYTTEDSTRFALDSRTNLAIGRFFRGSDYVHAQRHRSALTSEYLELLKTCDAIVTPTTACTAPPIPEKALPDGESNLPVVDQLMRFIRAGNLTGFPAIAVPAGYDSKGLPVSVHFLARPWEEDLLFRLGRVVEASVTSRLPAIHVRALAGA